jgi:hypothetical protein
MWCKRAMSRAVAAAALSMAAAHAGAVQMKNITINGLTYVPGMKVAAAASVAVAGNIIPELKDNTVVYGNYVTITQPNPDGHYPGFGFFANGTTSCTMRTEQGPIKPSDWPDPTRCFPLFSNLGYDGLNSLDFGYSMTTGFDASTGAFSKSMSLPLTGVAQTITYQLNRGTWGTSVPAEDSYGLLYPSSSFAQVFVPRIFIYLNDATQAPTAAAFAALTDDGSAITAKNVTARMTIPYADQGSAANLYIGAVVQGKVYLYTSASGWSLYSGGPFPIYKSVAALPAAQDIAALVATNLTGLSGATLYVGYQTINADSTLNPLQDGLVYTAP